MKRLIIATAICVLGCAVISFAVMPSTSTTSEEEDSGAVSSFSVAYTVKNFNGRVAVFAEGEEEPFKVTETQISTLPQADQESLKNGIRASSQSELARLLEDYCS